MKFNVFRNRLIISAILATPSYSILWIIRGMKFDISLYAHVEYSLTVFVILVILFELHNILSKYLERKLSWKTKFGKRLWIEFSSTVIMTPIVVTPIMLFLYIVIWKMGTLLSVVIEYNLFALTISFLIAVFVNSEFIIEEWKNSLLENEILEKESAKARLGALQAQISPHFLFNNFNVLNALIDEDQELAQKYLDVLSNVYRYVLNHKNEELVYLSSEVEFIREYLFLLKIRFDDKIKCHIEIDNLNSVKVPPATLQILVENAVKHNVITAENPLEISIKSISNDMIEIRNNLQPKKTAVKSTEVGLSNIVDRFKYFTDVPVQITRSAKDFIIQLPVLKTV